MVGWSKYDKDKMTGKNIPELFADLMVFLCWSRGVVLQTTRAGISLVCRNLTLLAADCLDQVCFANHKLQ